MKKGFTLVELSIVLVIIGLLTGGILVAQSLIDSAKINRVISEQEQYVSAMRLFDAQFKGLPGDSSKAARLLGASPDTWGGQDNGSLYWGEGPSVGRSEQYIAWEQLSLTGYIPKNASTADGVYSGDDAAWAIDVSASAPTSEVFENGYWIITGSPNTWSLGYSGTTTYVRHSIRLAGTVDGPSGRYPDPWTGPLTVKQVFSIDSKLDDGKPGSGDVMHHAANGNIHPCASGTNFLTATYDLDFEGEYCHVVFKLVDNISKSWY